MIYQAHQYILQVEINNSVFSPYGSAEDLLLQDVAMFLSDTLSPTHLLLLFLCFSMSLSLSLSPPLPLWACFYSCHCPHWFLLSAPPPPSIEDNELFFRLLLNKYIIMHVQGLYTEEEQEKAEEKGDERREGGSKRIERVKNVHNLTSTHSPLYLFLLPSLPSSSPSPSSSLFILSISLSSLLLICFSFNSSFLHILR